MTDFNVSQENEEEVIRNVVAMFAEIAEKESVSVTFDGRNSWQGDGRINIGYEPQRIIDNNVDLSEFETKYTLGEHESGHIVFDSDLRVMAKFIENQRGRVTQDTAKMVFNILEDIRTEHALGEIYIGSRQRYGKLRRYVIRESELDGQIETVVMAIRSGLDKQTTLQHTPLVDEATYDRMVKIMDSVKGGTVFTTYLIGKQLVRVIQKWKNQHNSTENSDAIWRWQNNELGGGAYNRSAKITDEQIRDIIDQIDKQIDRIRNTDNSLDKLDELQDVEPDDLDDLDFDGDGSSSSKNDKVQPDADESDKDDGSGSGQTGNQEDDSDDSSSAPEEAKEDSEEEAGGGSGAGTGDPLESLKELLKKTLEEGEKQINDVRDKMLEGDKQQKVDTEDLDNADSKIKSTRIEETKEYWLDRRGSTPTTVSNRAIVSRMRQFLSQIRTKNKWRNDIAGPIIDIDRLIQSRISHDGKSEIFRKSQRHQGVTVYVSVDLSGSMGYDSCTQVSGLLANLMDSCKNMNEIKLKAFGWSGGWKLTYAELLREDLGRISGSGGTPTDIAIMKGTDDMINEQGDKLLILITDGAPSCSAEEVKGAIDRARKEGIKVFTVLISSYETNLREMFGTDKDVVRVEDWEAVKYKVTMEMMAKIVATMTK